MSSGLLTSPSQPINNIYNTQNSDYNAQKYAYKSKNSPRTDPPPDSHNASSHISPRGGGFCVVEAVTAKPFLPIGSYLKKNFFLCLLRT
jgi:hypothetical protein